MVENISGTIAVVAIGKFLSLGLLKGDIADAVSN